MAILVPVNRNRGILTSLMAPQPLSSLDLPTPVKINQLIMYIDFPLHFEGLRISFYANYNLLSAEQNPEIVSTIYKWSRGLAACSCLWVYCY
jgi:hypothetical protein